METGVIHVSSVSLTTTAQEQTQYNRVWYRGDRGNIREQCFVNHYCSGTDNSTEFGIGETGVILVSSVSLTTTALEQTQYNRVWYRGDRGNTREQCFVNHYCSGTDSIQPSLVKGRPG